MLFSIAQDGSAILNGAEGRPAKRARLDEVNTSTYAKLYMPESTSRTVRMLVYYLINGYAPAFLPRSGLSASSVTPFFHRYELRTSLRSHKTTKRRVRRTSDRTRILRAGPSLPINLDRLTGPSHAQRSRSSVPRMRWERTICAKALPRGAASPSISSVQRSVCARTIASQLTLKICLAETLGPMSEQYTEYVSLLLHTRQHDRTARSFRKICVTSPQSIGCAMPSLRPLSALTTLRRPR